MRDQVTMAPAIWLGALWAILALAHPAAAQVRLSRWPASNLLTQFSNTRTSSSTSCCR
jgi:hypothetical protein